LLPHIGNSTYLYILKHIVIGFLTVGVQQFQKFIQEVNSQVPYNNGKINTVPIITYHDLTYNIQDYNKAATTITVPLFDQEMQYLHDNGFKVLSLNQFAFDPTNNVL
jgi:hypothetical protein